MLPLKLIDTLVYGFFTFWILWNLYKIAKARPLMSVSNARSLTFAAGGLAGMLGYWLRLWS
jgi:hypothetical protein